MRRPALALLFAICACARTPPPSSAPTQSPWEKVGVKVLNGVPQLGEVEIELKRTECMGWCPVYKVKLSGDGTLIYTGKSHVKNKGEHATGFDPEKLLPLLQRLTELDFLATKHKCAVTVVDNSHAWVSLRIGTRSNSATDEIVDVHDHALADLPADDALWHRKMFELENAIDAAADIDFWIGTRAERDANGPEWR